MLKQIIICCALYDTSRKQSSLNSCVHTYGHSGKEFFILPEKSFRPTVFFLGFKNTLKVFLSYLIHGFKNLPKMCFHATWKVVSNFLKNCKCTKLIERIHDQRWVDCTLYKAKCVIFHSTMPYKHKRALFSSINVNNTTDHVNASYMQFYIWSQIKSTMISKSYLNYISRNPNQMIVNLGPAASCGCYSSIIALGTI